MSVEMPIMGSKSPISWRNALMDVIRTDPSVFDEPADEELPASSMPDHALSPEDKSRMAQEIRNKIREIRESAHGPILVRLQEKPPQVSAIHSDRLTQFGLFGSADSVEPPRGGRALFEVIHAACAQLFRRLPEDHLLVHPQLNREFLLRCQALGSTASAMELNHALLNARKAGVFANCRRERVAPLDMRTIDTISHACELAGRCVQFCAASSGRRLPTIDHILCDPSLRAGFDAAADEISPKMDCEDEVQRTYTLRLGLLRFRKMGSSKLACAALDSLRAVLAKDCVRFDPESAPDEPGVYEVLADGRPWFVGSSMNLRERLRSHWEATGDGFLPAKWPVLRAKTLRLVIWSSSAENVGNLAASMKMQKQPLWNLQTTAA